MASLDANRVEEVLHRLDLMASETPSEFGILGRIRAKAFMKACRYDEAIHCLNETIQKWGEHVSLLGDLATCFYLMGDQVRWHSAVDQLSALFGTQRETLDIESYRRTAVLIGKFEEERGRIAQAISIYEEAYSFLVMPCEDAEQEKERTISLVHVLTQLARVRALYQPGKQLGDVYFQLVQRVSSDFSNQDLDIEIEHTLMQVDFVLVGVETSFERLRKVLSQPHLDIIDRRLLVFDFIETCLRRNERYVLSRLSDYMGSQITEDMTPFEEGLHSLAFHSGWRPDVEFIERLIAQSSLANALRSLTLILQSASNDENQTAFLTEVRKRTILLMSGLDAPSRAIWISFFDKELKDSSGEITVSKGTMLVSGNQRTVSLGRKKNLLKLLESLSERSSLSLDEACQILWNAEYNPSYYHRLRMQANRLNEVLFEVTERVKSIEIDSHSIRLADGLKLSIDS